MACATFVSLILFVSYSNFLGLALLDANEVLRALELFSGYTVDLDKVNKKGNSEPITQIIGLKCFNYRDALIYSYYPNCGDVLPPLWGYVTSFMEHVTPIMGICYSKRRDELLQLWSNMPHHFFYFPPPLECYLPPSE